MEPQSKGATRTKMLTCPAWEVLRAHYRQDHDLWSPRERARLEFLRWLSCTGRLGVGHGAHPPREFAGKEVAPQDG